MKEDEMKSRKLNFCALLSQPHVTAERTASLDFQELDSLSLSPTTLAVFLLLLLSYRDSSG